MLRDIEYNSHWPADMEFGAPVRIDYSPPVDRKFASPPETETRFVEGFATRYNRVHAHKGRIEVFRPGVFARSLLKNSNIRFLEDHDESRLLATTADGSLQLRSDEKGLSFQARLIASTEAQERAILHMHAKGKGCMSVGYLVHSSEVQKIDGTDVHFVNDASLTEVSLVTEGAVKEAFAYLLKAGERSSFEDKTAAGMASLGAYANLQRFAGFA